MWNGRAATYSLLTINYDPGAGLAFVGSMLMGGAGGVLLALVSFYRKRSRGGIVRMWFDLSSVRKAVKVAGGLRPPACKKVSKEE